MQRLGALLASLVLFSCYFDQDDPAGKSKKMVSLESPGGEKSELETEAVSCSQYLVRFQLPAKNQQLQKEEIKENGLPVPQEYDTFMVADDATEENVDPLTPESESDLNLKTVSVSKKALELFFDCIECRLVKIDLDGDGEYNPKAKFALKLKNGTRNFISDNSEDRIIVYGEGENPILTSDNRLVDQPMICAYRPGGEKNCVSIDTEKCEEENMINL